MGAEVEEAHRRQAILDSSPGAARIGKAIALVVVAIGLVAAVCVLLALLWLAVRLAGTL
jgi:hypothetical protein